MKYLTINGKIRHAHAPVAARSETLAFDRFDRACSECGYLKCSCPEEGPIFCDQSGNGRHLAPAPRRRYDIECVESYFAIPCLAIVFFADGVEY